MRRRPPPALAAALLALCGALTTAGLALHRALVLEPLPAPARGGAALPDVVVAARSAVDTALLLAAVEKGPFHPERRRPSQRFLLPGESEEQANGEENRARGELRVIGTVVLAKGGGFATAQVGAEPPRLVRVGERIGGYTLRGVQPGRAVFASSAGTTLVVDVPKPGT